MFLENRNSLIDEELIIFLQKCRHLDFLDVEAHLAVPTVEIIYQMQKEHKIGQQ